MKKQKRVSTFSPCNAKENGVYYRVMHQENVYCFGYFPDYNNHISWVDETGKNQNDLTEGVYEACTSIFFQDFLNGKQLTYIQLEKMCAKMSLALIFFSYDTEVSLACIDDRSITFQLMEYYYDYDHTRPDIMAEKVYGNSRTLEFNQQVFEQFLAERKMNEAKNWFKYNYLKLED